MLTGTGLGPLSADEGPSLWLVSGIAPPGVRRVRIQVEEFQTDADVEPVTGAFLVGLPEWPEWPAISAVDE
jgi:hypothetical protein